MEKVSKTYDPVSLTRILQSLERRIEALQQLKLRRIKSVAADAAQNLAVNEPGYVLDDSQNVDFVFRAEDGRMYRFSGQASAVAATPSSPAGVFVLKAGDTMTGALVIDGSLEVNADFNHDGSNVGFYGVTPAVRPSAYTISNGLADRILDCDATTIDEIADLISTIQNDLKLQGLSQ